MKLYYLDRPSRSIADLSPCDDGTWQVHRINVPVPERGKRIGSGLLDTICREADKERATLWLLPVPSGGLGRKALVTWYVKRGFRWAGKANHSQLVRLPR